MWKTDLVSDSTPRNSSYQSYSTIFENRKNIRSISFLSTCIFICVINTQYDRFQTEYTYNNQTICIYQKIVEYYFLLIFSPTSAACFYLFANRNTCYRLQVTGERMEFTVYTIKVDSFAILFNFPSISLPNTYRHSYDDDDVAGRIE